MVGLAYWCSHGRIGAHVPTGHSDCDLRPIPRNRNDRPTPRNGRKACDAGPMTRLQEVMNRLDEIARDCIKADWDGYGAHPVGPRTIANARRLMKQILCHVDISPTPSGCLTLSIDVDDHEILIEVGDYTGSVDF